jgi:hypothetical protein
MNMTDLLTSTRWLTLVGVLLLLASLGGCPPSGGGGGDDDDATVDDDDAQPDDDDAQPDDDDTAPACASDETEDCNGHCGPTSWIGDDSCDDGAFEWEGNDIDFNCAALNFDDGDCEGGDDDDDTTPPECTVHTQCDDDEFCRDGECEMIFNRSFDLTVVSAVADQFDANNNNWDVSDPPDMKAVVRLDGDIVLETDPVDDSLTATWNESDSVVLTPTSLCIEVIEVDAFFSDTMDTGCWNGQDPIVGLVRNDGYVGDLAAGLVNVRIELSPNF